MMAVSRFKYYLIVLMSCAVNFYYCYNLERIMEDKSISSRSQGAVNVEINLYDTSRFPAFLNEIEQAEEEVEEERERLDRSFGEIDPNKSTKPPSAGDVSNRGMFVAFIPSSYGNNNDTGASDNGTPLDSWSVVWYIASFGGLIAFFLIVSCSEWCCRRAVRNSQNNRNGIISPSMSTTTTPTVPDTPPPSYDQFAPPSYESITLGRRHLSDDGEKSQYDIYVVPVHALASIVESHEEMEDAPPSYSYISSDNRSGNDGELFLERRVT